MARIVSREREISIRAALGAGRGRLVRSVLLENLLVLIVGSAAGILLGYWGFKLITVYRADLLPLARELKMGATPAVFAIVLGRVGALVCTLVPVVSALRPRQSLALNDVARGSTEGRERGWSRRLLVVAEVSLCLMLVAGAGLLIRVFNRVAAVDPGFDPTSRLTLEYRVPRNKYPTAQQQWNFHREVVERVRAVPGVRSAASIFALPFSGNYGETTLVLPDRPVPARGSELHTAINRASPTWFETMRIPLLQGRYIEGRDHSTAPKVVVVSRTFVQRHWPGRIRSGDWCGCRICTMANLRWSVWSATFGTGTCRIGLRFSYKLRSRSSRTSSARSQSRRKAIPQHTQIPCDRLYG